MKSSPKPARHVLYAKIQIAKKEIGLDEATYRTVMFNLFGVNSAKKLSERQLVELVNHFKARGFKPKKAASEGRKVAVGREHSKMRALWLSLWHLGVISDASEEALVGFARRVTGGKSFGIEALQWVRADDASAVIEALKERLARDGGVNWSPLKDASNRVVDDNPRHRVIEAQRRRLRSLGVTPCFASDYLLSDQKADDLIAAQGEAIRRLNEEGKTA